MKTVIQLGRAGDVLSVLPLLQQHPSEYNLMVAEEYSPVAQAQTIVETVIFKGKAWEIGNAIAQCKQEGRDWVCTQVNGPREAVEEFVWKPNGMMDSTRTSFQKDMYRALHRLHEWDYNYPLIINLRTREREEALIKEWRPKKGKFILAAMDGISSPFPYKALALELLKQVGWPVVDLGQVKAHTITDLLALYEEAACLIAIDSAPLQLARALPSLPVIALTRDTPLLWNGSAWRPSHWWYCRYSDFPLRAVEMLQAIRNCMRFTYKTVGTQKVIHVWNAYEGAECARPAEWWIPTPITVGSCGRDSLMLKDEKRLPYLRDALRMALQKAGAEDWVCLTRPETFFAEDAPKDLTTLNAAFAYRIETDGTENTYRPIGDMFWALKKVWLQLLPEIPDLILGSDVFWSHALVALFRGIGAADVTGYCTRVKQ